MPLNRIGRVGPMDAYLVPVAGASTHLSVTDVSAEFDVDLGATETFLFTCDTDCYVAQGAAPTAAAADGSMVIPARQPIVIDGAEGARVAVVRVATAEDPNVATLQKMKALV